MPPQMKIFCGIFWWILAAFILFVFIFWSWLMRFQNCNCIVPQCEAFCKQRIWWIVLDWLTHSGQYSRLQPKRACMPVPKCLITKHWNKSTYFEVWKFGENLDSLLLEWLKHEFKLQLDILNQYQWKVIC